MDPEALPPYTRKTKKDVCRSNLYENVKIIFTSLPLVAFLIIVLLFTASGVIIAPILDRVNYETIHQEWTTSHQPCQCKFITATSVDITCENKTEESFTFTKGDSKSHTIGVNKQCFVKHPVNTISDIAESNPYATYYFLDVGISVGAFLWFVLGCVTMPFLLLGIQMLS